jgi:hypothetical protein
MRLSTSAEQKPDMTVTKRVASTELDMARIARTPAAFPSWTWTAVLAGVFTSLVVQILLTMLGFGVGLLSVDFPTLNEAPRAAGHLAFAWWAISGIIAAFSGGAVAAANSPDQTDAGRIWHSMAAWAVTIVLVVGASGLTAGSTANVAGNLAGPSVYAFARMDRLARATARDTAGQARPTQAQAEEARRHFAYVMLASFAALLCGGFAAYGAGMAVTPRVSQKVAETVT